MKISINVGAINRMRSGGDMELCVKCAGFGKGKSGKICLKCDGIGVVSALAAQGETRP